MTAARGGVELLKQLEPIRALSEPRLRELAELCIPEKVGRNADPFRSRGIDGQLIYLLKGELALGYAGGRANVLVGGTPEARFPIGKPDEPFVSAKAITDIVLIRIDDEVLDIMSTWDQLAADSPEHTPTWDPPSRTNWTIMTGMFSVKSLKQGPFSQLPAAHIDALLKRFVRMDAKAGEVIVKEGAEGDYYYVLEKGKCRVERVIGGVSVLLAELKSGDAFGEEALVSDVKRNATVTMKNAGSLLRLGKDDFLELLKEPLLQRLSMEQARKRITRGGKWLDVRYPSEYQYDKLPGALNVPLSEIRNAFEALDKSCDYVVYCQSGRRSSAAAFLLAQRGFSAYLLNGGLRNGGARYPC